ncbi:hypothetical protein NL676_031644 [Syzygium grande]|nr:hypothetical protein NL676_031644 [Syzygium grande]
MDAQASSLWSPWKLKLHLYALGHGHSSFEVSLVWSSLSWPWVRSPRHGLASRRFVETRKSNHILSPSQEFSGVGSQETHNAYGENGMLLEHTIISSDVFSGTPMFMAPEVARNEEQSFPSDVWSVGCTIIEMATGNRATSFTGLLGSSCEEFS